MKVVFIQALVLLFASFGVAKADSFIIDTDKMDSGTNVMSRDCRIDGTNVFTSAALKTIVTDERAYSGRSSLKLTIPEGGKGFGGFGGVISFNKCFEKTPRIYSGDEVWVRLRIFVPEDFEWNLNGRNKFLRFRAFHFEDNKKKSEGYNDLYLDARNLDSVSATPYDFIFEGAQRWYGFASPKDFLRNGKWETVEYYLKLDHLPKSEGGESTMRFWVNGKLLGETFERVTLKTAESFVDALYFFTYWDNKGAHKTQSLFVDDFFLTTDIPQDRDEYGNAMIGLGEGFTQPKMLYQCPVP